MSVNIVLTGLMGCGKSTVGKLISKELKDYIYVDTDDIIVGIEEMSISDIFAQKTEAYFRELEEKVIEELSQEENLIISLGGGAYESKKNRENLSKTGMVFYLKASTDTLYDRIKEDTTRPLLKCDNPKSKLEELLKKREPNYLKSDFVIDTDKKTLKEVVDDIIKNVQEQE